MSGFEQARPHGADLRSYGRQRGRKLSARQQQLLEKVLPRVTLEMRTPLAGEQPLAQSFAAAHRQLWLEIGFGGGEHLTWQAANHPDVGLIGCEPYIDGIVKVLSQIEQRQLANIRLYVGDAREVLRALPPACVDRVFVLFPDPWPKRRQAKRRLINAETLRLLARLMTPGAELRIATDVGDYARSILLAITASGGFEWPALRPRDWRQRSGDWPDTRYERKAIAAGRTCYYFRFHRRRKNRFSTIATT